MLTKYTLRSILDASRPCVILGSAPQPHLPQPFPAEHSLICVNSSGWVAKENGWPQPDLTVLGGFKLSSPHREEDRAVLRGLTTQALLLVTHYPHDAKLTLAQAREKLAELSYDYEMFRAISPWRRMRIIEAVTGRRSVWNALETLVFNQKRHLRTSLGTFAACLALFLGVPKVIIAGMSLTEGGHAYPTQERRRFHIETDRAVLKALVERDLPVATTERALSVATGMPLV